MDKQKQNIEIGTKIINFYEEELNKHFEVLNDYLEIINNNIKEKEQVNNYIQNIKKYYINFFLSVSLVSIQFIYILIDKYIDYMLHQFTIFITLCIGIFVLEIYFCSKYNFEFINKYLRPCGDKKFIHFNKFDTIMNTNNRITLSINNVNETLKNLNYNSNKDTINNNHNINNTKELSIIRNRNIKKNLIPNISVHSKELKNNKKFN